MKLDKKQIVVGQTPRISSVRSKLLRRIRQAKLPKDADQFTLAELRETGLEAKYTKPKDLAENHFKRFVLLATQNELLCQECDNLHREIENKEDYYSPIWDELRHEPDPIKQAAITRQAEADEARVAKERADKKKSQDDSFRKFLESFGRRPWENRDRRGRVHNAVLWHEPMTVSDYHSATGIIRRTLQNILDRLKAKPITKSERKNEAPHYSSDTNFEVLTIWLTKHIKKPADRRAWLVKTLLKCVHEAPEHLKALAPALKPVFRSLGIDNPTNDKNFWDYFSQCDALLYPPLPDISKLDPFASLVVGKTT